jgi:hypothetical protein
VLARTRRLCRTIDHSRRLRRSPNPGPQAEP